MALTDKFYERTKSITEFKIADLPDIDLSEIHREAPVKIEGFAHPFVVDVVSPTESYIQFMKELFNFEQIKLLIQREDFKVAFDGMNGVGGPYLIDIFHKELGVPMECLHN